jgi:hypothetical protein
MKSLTQLKTTLTESNRLDEIALKTAVSAYKKRLERGEYKKAAKTGQQLTDKIKRQQIKEESAWSLPTVLILQRKTIRNFSDGTKVALYYNSKLNKYFTIPIRDAGIPNPQFHDPITVSESEIMNLFASEDTVELKDGKIGVVENVDAISGTYESLNEENKIIFLEQFTKNIHTFEKIVKFCERQHATS